MTIRLSGELEIDTEKGTIRFIQHGYLILNITHIQFPASIPQHGAIELVALPALTSHVPRVCIDE
jgi:hypothetical protein